MKRVYNVQARGRGAFVTRTRIFNYSCPLKGLFLIVTIYDKKDNYDFCQIGQLIYAGFL